MGFPWEIFHTLLLSWVSYLYCSCLVSPSAVILLGFLFSFSCSHTSLGSKAVPPFRVPVVAETLGSRLSCWVFPSPEYEVTRQKAF